MRALLRILVALLALSAVSFLIWKVHANTLANAAKTGPRGAQVVPVTLAEATSRDIPVWLQGIGTVQASNTVTVRPRVGGTLESVGFSEGSIVQQGDVLARIDPRPFQSVLSQAQAKKLQDEAQLTNANAALERAQKLAKENAVSQQLLDQAEAAAGQLAAQVKSDQAAIDAAQLDLDFTVVRAPIKGRTGIRRVDAGNEVTASQAEGLVVLTQLQPVTLIFTLPQRDLAALSPHMKPGSPPIKAQAVDEDGKTLDEGTLELVDNQIDDTTGTLRLKASFPNQDYKLWPGQYLSGRVLVETKEDSLVVPTETVQPGLKGSFVYLVKEDQTVEARQVTTGMSFEGMTVIEQGLKPGDRVVREGQNKLKPGAKVSEKKAGT